MFLALEHVEKETYGNISSAVKMLVEKHFCFLEANFVSATMFSKGIIGEKHNVSKFAQGLSHSH